MEFGSLGSLETVDWKFSRAPAARPGLWITLWIVLITGEFGEFGSLTRGLTDMTTMPLY